METTRIEGDKVVDGDYFVGAHLSVAGSLRVKGFIEVLGKIYCGGSIESGRNIKAGGSIEAGGGIKAGGGIEAGEDYGIYAGLSLRLSQKKKMSLVLAKTKPKNIQLGSYKKSVEHGWAWHVHHELLAEHLTEPIENRIKYIKSDKPEAEQDTRLRLLKKMKGTFSTYEELIALHAKECPDCPWNGTTIFPQ